jgi:hypothetical protein
MCYIEEVKQFKMSPSKLKKSILFSSKLATYENYVYFYLGNEIIRISANEKLHMQKYLILDGKFSSYVENPLIKDSFSYHLGYMDRERCLVKTDLEFNFIWKRELGKNIFRFNYLDSNEGYFYCSTENWGKYKGFIYKFNPNGDVEWVYKEKMGFINVSKGCTLEYGKLVFPIFNDLREFVAFKIINKDGDIESVISSDIKKIAHVSILKDEEKRVLLLFYPFFDYESRFYDFQYKIIDDINKTIDCGKLSAEFGMILDVLFFINGEDVIYHQQSVVYHSNESTDYEFARCKLKKMSLILREERSLMTLWTHFNNIKKLSYGEYIFLTAITQESNFANEILVFDKNFNLICRHNMNDKNLALYDIKIINDYIFVLEHNVLRIFKFHH